MANSVDTLDLLSIRFSSWELAQSQKIKFVSWPLIVLPIFTSMLTADENAFFTCSQNCTCKAVLCRSNAIMASIWKWKVLIEHSLSLKSLIKTGTWSDSYFSHTLVIFIVLTVSKIFISSKWKHIWLTNIHTMNIFNPSALNNQLNHLFGSFIDNKT